MNVLDLAQQNGRTYRKVSTHNGGEYHGPCPTCGGADRFHIWPAQGENGTFWCRQCDKAGDAIEYLITYEGKGFREAAGIIGKEIPEQDENQRPQFRKQGQTVEAFQPRQCAAPVDLWQQHAGKLIDWAHQQLLVNQTQLDWLAGRGLDLDAVKRYTLGWNPGEKGRDLYRVRESWGLDSVLKEDGVTKKKLWIPIGLVIPCFQGDRLHRVRIRRPEGEPRYYLIPGSGTAPMIQGAGSRAFVVVESELDALLIHHLAGALVGSISQGNSTAKPDETAHASLQSALAILVSLDSDQAGMQASVWWRKQYPQAERWPVPVGKDPGDAFKAGVNLLQWVKEGLPPVLTLPPKPRPVPAPVPVPAAPEHDHTGNVAPVNPSANGEGANRPIVAKLQTKQGHEFYVTNIPAEYTRLQAEGATVFNPAEMDIIKQAKALGATDHEMQIMFEGKRVFGGCFTEIEDLRERN